MNKPNVTVIMPVYNAALYLKESLGNLLQQTLTDIEIICVDDGSRDNSLEVMREYEREYSGLRVIHQENLGAAVARNNGLKLARGKYVIFLDADDVYDINMLEKAFNKAEETQAEVVVFAVNIFSDDTDIRRAEWMLDEKIIGDSDVIKTEENYQHIFNFSGCNPWNKLILKSLVDDNDIWFQDIKRANDVYFISMVMALSNKIAFVKEPLINYRQLDTSLQGTNTGENLEFFYALAYLREELKKRGMLALVENSFKKMALEHCVNMLWGSPQYECFASMHRRYKEIADKLGIAACIDSNIKKTLEYKNYILLSECKNSVLTYELIKMHRLLNSMESKKKWKVPYEKIENYKDIVIYGAGNVGQDIYAELSVDNNYNIVGWFDQNHYKFSDSEYKIEAVEKIKEKKFDCVIIAINDEHISAMVEENLKNNLGLKRVPIIKI